MRLQIDLIRARLRAPFVSSARSLDVRELLLVRLEAPDGAVGYGEAAPLGVPTEEVRAALEDCQGALAGELAAELPPPARSAIDLAMWDLAGRRADQPVWRLLGASATDPVEVNYTIAAASRDGAAGEASAARVAGFGCAKVKVGLGDDTSRLAAVRAATGPDMRIRLDANGAWSADEALAALDALAPTQIELCEEPTSGLEATGRVAAASPVRVAIDETAVHPGALERRVCDAMCMKIARCGGITGLLDTARRAHAAGYETYLASSLDGPLGIAAALHAAAVLRPGRACGLATLGLFDGRPDVLPVSEGLMGLPAGPGLGDGLLGWYGAS